MNIVVCLKPSNDPARIGYDPRTGMPLRPAEVTLGQRDAVALQAALDFARARDARVTALSVADERAESLLRQALQTGAVRAIRLWHEHGGVPPDTWAAATAAAAAVVALEADLVFCASQSEDSGGEWFPAVLAATAAFGLASRVLSLSGDGGAFEAVQKLESGWRARHRIGPPAVIAVDAEMAQVRHVTVLGRSYRAGLARRVERWTPAAAGLTAMPAPLVEEIELALPRARARTATPDSGLSARDRLRRKKPQAAESAPSILQGPPDSVARALLERFEQWLR